MKGKRPEKVDPMSGLTEPPPPPSDLMPAAQAEWRRAAKVLVDNGLFDGGVYGILRNYCSTLAMADLYESDIAKTGAIVPSKAGTMKAHPLIGPASKARQICARIAADIGLTAATRSRKGMPRPKEPSPEDLGAPAGLDL